MLPFILTTLLPTLALAQSSSNPCLIPAEAANIGLRWLQIFQTDVNGTGTGSFIVPSTISPTKFLYYDEGASFGDPEPVYHNMSELVDTVTGAGYTGTQVTDVKYTVLHSSASCDTIALRWLSESKAAKGDGVTVPVGTPVQYKGNDYLHVDLATRLIDTVWSSSDLMNFYIGLGDDVIKTQLAMGSG